MKIHEYQAKQLLAEHGLDVPRGRVCSTVDEATAAYAELGSEFVVVKAQIHAGGRGKGGGVKLARSAEEVSQAAEAILGMDLVTPQTGPEGQRVRKIWVEEGSAIAKEYYVGVVIDRERDMPVMMASSEGGMDIEEVAANSPEKILKAPFSPATGLDEADARRLATGIGMPAELVDEAARFLVGLAQLYVDKDCSLAEINPLVHTEDGPCAPSTPRSTSIPAACSVTPSWPSCAIWTRRTPRRSRPAGTTSPTSPWTATSPAWSTARASPWPPWT
jgi:succinyl-CoA synthetase beta subunit